MKINTPHRDLRGLTVPRALGISRMKQLRCPRRDAGRDDAIDLSPAQQLTTLLTGIDERRPVPSFLRKCCTRPQEYTNETHKPLGPKLSHPH